MKEINVKAYDRQRQIKEQFEGNLVSFRSTDLSNGTSGFMYQDSNHVAIYDGEGDKAAEVYPIIDLKGSMGGVRVTIKVEVMDVNGFIIDDVTVIDKYVNTEHQPSFNCFLMNVEAYKEDLRDTFNNFVRFTSKRVSDGDL
jgi:hypothetical protein